MAEFHWEDPPADGRGLHSIPFDKFRTEPFRWARLERTFTERRYAAAATSRINTGMYRGIERGEFQAVSRGIRGAEPPQWGVWVRFVGAQADVEEGDDE